ncbi:hypothetical protein [Streptomyces cadmiisoli]|uniref:hypothetical protein n=1 Tax=Streptomyces cadmiisoli TaxID=2184053 RepID=UPI00366955F4
MNPTRRTVLLAGAAAALLPGVPAAAAPREAAEQGERSARFELRSVGELYNASDPVTVHHTW